MILNESQWHVRLYRWCRTAWNTFRDDNDWGEQDNLCKYIRSIFVWAPLAVLSQVALFAWAGYVLIYYPITRIGWTGFAYEVFAVLACAVVVLLCSWAAKLLRERRYARKRQRSSGRRESLEYQVKALQNSSPPLKQKGIAFVELVFDFLVAMKEKTCPTIEIVSEERSEKHG